MGIEENINVAGLESIIESNPSVDWSTIDLGKKSTRELVDFGEIDSNEAIKLVKAYQRIVRMLGEEDLEVAKSLLLVNVHSSIQVAAMSKDVFLEKCKSAFKNKDDGYALKVFKKAKAIRSQILLNYINSIQKNELHIKQLKVH
ncbi:hypothetical protein OE749_01265 [Aestuariibacter sp. AA17]|uniref:Uncharacterized protein n=1 Tax=Fluctibacter corallii TaxID=2984329 RepID=A0ABT3A3V5_9ALTE|nr:hypothetical protein [Aestuariibacter sp. AA17]MCV2883324.1 hypothetical protein [Aestuariibacter sp. AA17]